MKHSITLIFATAFAFTLAGCAQNPLSGRDYTPGQVRSVQKVEYGTVVQVSPARINPQQSGRILNRQQIGPAAGAAAGAILGSAFGGGKGKLLTGVAGGIVGGIVGGKIQHSIETRPGVLLTIRFPARGKKAARVEAVAQQTTTDSPRLRAGEWVMVLSGTDGTVRVIPATPPAGGGPK